MGLLEAPLDQLMQRADRLRRERFGDKVHLCAIVNAKSGLCSQDCAFCAQARGAQSEAGVYPLMSAEDILQRGLAAAADGARHFSIVTSGLGPTAKEMETIEAALEAQAATGIGRCASLGVMNRRSLERLKTAGLDTYHHNMEAAPAVYERIVSTRTYAMNEQVILDAKAAGLTTCCGGIFGLGESWQERLDLLHGIKKLDPDRVPINFLSPIPGTPLADQPIISSDDALRSIAMARIIMPDKTILLAGGREAALGERQAEIFRAGANGLMIGDYLTTAGRSVKDDLTMIRGAGLTVSTSDE